MVLSQTIFPVPSEFEIARPDCKFNIYICEVTEYSYESTSNVVETNITINLLLSSVRTEFYIFGVLTNQSSTITKIKALKIFVSKLHFFNIEKIE